MKKQISVTGYISGDYESFCLDVKDSDYEKIKNKHPIEDRKSFLMKIDIDYILKKFLIN